MREAGDEVAPPEFRRIDLHFTRRRFNDSLDHIGRLGPPGAAIGINRRGIGINRVDLRIDGGNIVLARQQRGVEIGRHAGREGRKIGPHRGDCVDLEGR